MIKHPNIAEMNFGTFWDDGMVALRINFGRIIGQVFPIATFYIELWLEPSKSTIDWSLM